MGVFKKRVVGIEINDLVMHVVELSGAYNNPEIIKYGKKRLAEGIVKEGKMVNHEEFRKALNELLKETGIKSKKVVLGVNNNDVVIRFLRLPKVIDRKKIGNFLNFQASDYIPFNVEEFELDYMVTGEQKTEEGDFYNVMLVAARRSMIYEFLKAFESTRLILKDIKSSALVLDIFLQQEHEARAYAIANVSSGVCSVLIVDNKIPVFARTVYMGKARDAASIASNASGEIRLTILYFQSQNRLSVVEKVFLLGHDAAMAGIKEHMENALNIDTEILMPFKHLYSRETGEEKQEEKAFDAAEYAVALSLALHGLKEYGGVKMIERNKLNAFQLYGIHGKKEKA
jgi:Tfp pilus assembly PilM family ATPase